MSNIDFKNLQTLSVEKVAQEKTIYSEYVATGNPEMLDPNEVERITIGRNKFDKSNQAVQQTGGRRGSIMAQVQLMFDNQPKDDHVRDLQLAVEFKASTGLGGVTYYALADEMKQYLQNGTLYEGIELTCNQVALQRFVHRELKPIRLAYVDVASLPAKA